MKLGKITTVYAVGQGHTTQFVVYRLYIKKEVANQIVEALNKAYHPPLPEHEKYWVREMSLV